MKFFSSFAICSIFVISLFISCTDDYDVNIETSEKSLSSYLDSAEVQNTRTSTEKPPMIMISWRNIPGFERNFDQRGTMAVFSLARVDPGHDFYDYDNYLGTEDIQMWWPDSARVDLQWLYDGRGHKNPNFYLPNDLKIYSNITHRLINAGDIHNEVLWNTPYYLYMCMYQDGKWINNIIYVIQGFELGGGGDQKVFEIPADIQPLYPGSLEDWNDFVGI